MALLVDVWIQPEIVKKFNGSDWSLLIRQARNSSLLATLGWRIKRSDLKQYVPERVWLHFSSAMLLATRQQTLAKTELKRLSSTLEKLNIKAVVLKGAAYSLQEKTLSQGRLFEDIDILFDKTSIPVIENELWFLGFLPTTENDYDKQYYRNWMHEIPPLQHIKRKTVLDIHHNILPLTAKTKVNMAALSVNTMPTQFSMVDVLSPEAQILHSATHLFHEGEFNKSLRDLIDLQQMLDEYILSNENLSKLTAMAKASHLELPLFLAIRYCVSILNLEVPELEMAKINELSPSKLRLTILDKCYLAVFSPYHSSSDSPLKRVASFILYIRSHLLRMPLYLLIPHLLRKFWRQLTKSGTDSNTADIKEKPNF